MIKRMLLIMLALCVMLCAVPTYADEWEDDDDDWFGGGYSGGGESYDDGPGTLYDVYVDDTEYNYCQDCGRDYIGTGDCPYPDCPSHNLH